MSVEITDTGTRTVIELIDAATDSTGSSRWRIQFNPIVAEGNFERRDYIYRPRKKNRQGPLKPSAVLETV